MKTLKNILESSLLDDIDNILADGDAQAPRVLIQEYLEENYDGKWTISEKPNKDGLFEVSSNTDINVKNTKITSLTNGQFIWTSVKGEFNCFSYNLTSLEGAPNKVGHIFDCAGCEKLKSLEGAPKEVGIYFDCSGCKSLKSLEGAPKSVSHFYCSSCKSLTSLDGAPKKVGGSFNCAQCVELKSLNGAPEKIGLHFDCSNCKNLISLEGAPKIVGGSFYCFDCVKKFTTNDVKKVSKISGRIFC